MGDFHGMSTLQSFVFCVKKRCESSDCATRAGVSKVFSRRARFDHVKVPKDQQPLMTFLNNNKITIKDTYECSVIQCCHFHTAKEQNMLI